MIYKRLFFILLLVLPAFSLAQERQYSLQLVASDPYHFEENWSVECWLLGSGTISELYGSLLTGNNLIAITALDSIPGLGTGLWENEGESITIDIQWPIELTVVDSLLLTVLQFQIMENSELGDSLSLSWVAVHIPEEDQVEANSLQRRITTPVRMHFEPDWTWGGDDEFELELWLTTDMDWNETIGMISLGYENAPGVFEWNTFDNFTTDFGLTTITDSSMISMFDFWGWIELPDSSSAVIAQGEALVSDTLIGEVYELNGIGAQMISGMNPGLIDQLPNPIAILDPNDPGLEYNSNDLQVLQDIIDDNELVDWPILLGDQIWEDTRLVELNLSYLDDEGALNILPNSIGELEQLRELRLSSNHLTELPESIGDLVNLVELRLNSNDLISLPTSLGALENLEYLSLNHNDLEYVNESICDLTNLEILGLRHNQVQQLPECLGDLISIEVLDVNENQLTELPESIGNMESLDRIHAEFNQLTELPASIGNLTQITEIHLYLNELVYLPDEIGNLINLENLDLRSNQLTVLPESINGLESLQTLTVGLNQLSSLPVDLSGMTSLENIYCPLNQFTELPDAIASVPNLIRLRFQYNQLTSLPDWLCDLNLNWSMSSSFNVEHNLLCTGAPECVEPYLGIQDCTGYGTIWYVSTQGSNENTGTLGDPWAEIQHAIDQSTHGDTILVLPGTYHESLNFNEKNIILSSNYIFDFNESTIDSTIIDGDQQDRVIRVAGEQDQGCRIIGLTITHGYSSGLGGGLFIDDSNPVIRDCRIVGNHAETSGGGIYFSSSHEILLQNVLLANNSAEFGSAVNCFGFGDHIFTNCTIVNNPASNGAVIYKQSNRGLNLVNSIFWCGDDPDCELVSDMTDFVVNYSLLPLDYPGTGNINYDPLFVNSDVGDYHLVPESPCIDACDPAGEIDPDCTPPDMGAFFFNQCADFGIAGDIILDGILDILDIVAMVSCIMEGEQSPPCICADLNNDCILDILDIVTMVDYILNS